MRNKKVKQMIVSSINQKCSCHDFSVEWDKDWPSKIGIIERPFDGFVDHEYELGTVSIKGKE